MALSSNIGHVKRSAVVKSVSRWKVNLGKKDRMFIINRQQKDFYMLFMIDISSLFNSVLLQNFEFLILRTKESTKFDRLPERHGSVLWALDQ